MSRAHVDTQSPANAVEYRNRLVKPLLLALVGLGFVTIFWWTFSKTNDSRLLRLLCLAFFGSGALYAIGTAMRRTPQVVVDDRGIEDRRLRCGVILWTDIRRLWTQSIGSAAFVCVDVSDPDAYLARMSLRPRLVSKWNRVWGFPPISLNWTFLDAPPERATLDMKRRWNAAAPWAADPGFCLLKDVVGRVGCERLAENVDVLGTNGVGSRRMLDHAWCRDFAAALRMHPDLQNAVPVQCTLFDKNEDVNWSVAPHQDLFVPVAERVDDPACTGWSEKEGILFVQPPVALLEKMIALRVHLDDCGPDNGPLSVVPGSHRAGRLSEADALHMTSRHGVVECTASRGDVLVMSPLLLHRSAKAASPSRRRVLHLLYGPPDPPCGLKWRTWGGS
jgi:hypothetical protein